MNAELTTIGQQLAQLQSFVAGGAHIGLSIQGNVLGRAWQHTTDSQLALLIAANNANQATNVAFRFQSVVTQAKAVVLYESVPPRTVNAGLLTDQLAPYVVRVYQIVWS